MVMVMVMTEATSSCKIVLLESYYKTLSPYT